jgi:hypothetical protein
MSDIEKVYARACLLGSDTPIQLRWEGSGDSVHAATLLHDLQGRSYPDTTIRIKYNAIINVYEGGEDAITKKAIANMAAAHTGAADSQTYTIWYNADVTRASRSIEAQPLVHIMFVRNIMLTSGSGDSQTGAGEDLLNLHNTALRNRSNSLTDSGQIRLGISGAPGIAVPRSGQSRPGMPVKYLFSGFGQLTTSAEAGGLALVGGKNRQAWKDADLGEVMKNNGTSLGQKNTYYLTFQK